MRGKPVSPVSRARVPSCSLCSAIHWPFDGSTVGKVPFCRDSVERCTVGTWYASIAFST